MPSGGKKRSRKTVAITPDEDPRLSNFDFNEEDEQTLSPSEGVGTPGMQTTSSENMGGVSANIQSMMNNFRVHINKAFDAKKQRVEASTGVHFKDAYKKDQETIDAEEEWQMLHYEYGQKFKTLFQEWDLEMQQYKEKQEKLTKLINEQKKILHQTTVLRRQRQKKIVQLHEEFLKNLEELDKNEDNLFNDTLKGLEESMTMLQNQTITKTEEQVMSNI